MNKTAFVLIPFSELYSDIYEIGMYSNNSFIVKASIELFRYM